MGLSALALCTCFQNGRIDSTLEGNTRFGKVDGILGIAQQFGNNINNAPVSGRVNISVPDLGSLKSFIPATAQGIIGRLNATTTIGGRPGSPTVNSNPDLQTSYGRVDGTVNIGQGTSFDTAPLSDKLNLNAANPEVFRNFLPVGQTLKGHLNAAVNLAGRLNDPQLSGQTNGDSLYYRHQTQGLIFDNGILCSRL